MKEMHASLPSESWQSGASRSHGQGHTCGDRVIDARLE